MTIYQVPGTSYQQLIDYLQDAVPKSLSVRPLKLYSNHVTVLVQGYVLQWNPYIADTIGEIRFGRYRGVAFVEGYY